ncbi:hypothetical protein ACGFX4_05590 [Kitasatospora sp. NPDC048365]|uniref:hypothetical protein n=1 Tax=Kitasatospora sp. NPDC048365 TaxID=3364050 RepID=UPI00370FBF9F
MFAALTDAFPVTAREARPGDLSGYPDPVRRVLGPMGGTTLADGLYRFHTADSAASANAACAELVPGFAERYGVFAFDWLGREFAVNTEDGTVAAVDFGSDEFLESELSLDEWHDVVAAEADDLLLLAQYLEWRAANPQTGPLAFDQVVCHRHPLFLGGADEVDNLELSDKDVHRTLFTQIAVQVRDLPPGTPIHLDLG